MRDKRRVDELSIEELEQVLALRKREERQQRLERIKRSGRLIEPDPATVLSPPPPVVLPGQDFETVIVKTAQNPSGVAFVDEATAPVGKGLEPLPPSPIQRAQRRSSRVATNTLLTLVEIVAVVGLVFLAFQLFEGITILEQNSAEAQIAAEEARSRSIPTLEPTPILTLNKIVLPGGHKWVEGQTPTLNVDEIPDNLRFAVADQILRPIINRPPVTDQTPLRLIIPKINVDQAIVQGSDWEALKQGVGQVLNGYTPADADGNVALSAHNDIYGELFKHLDQLQPGDQYQIQTRSQVYLYTITHIEVVKPTDVHVLDTNGKATSILISCYPYRVNTQRIVVFAERTG